MSIRAKIGEGGPAGSGQARRPGFGRAADHVLFGLVPVVVTLALFAFELGAHGVGLDFRVAYWPAAIRMLHGASPYAVTRHEITAGLAFVYPALSAVLIAPFGLLSSAVARVLWVLPLIACIPAILWTLNVKDWRLYGLAMLWSPVFDGWESGNLTLPLTLAIALSWRHRDRPVVAGLLTAVAISLKPFVWPLGLWLLVTRRWKAAGWAIVAGLTVNLVAWWIVGFGEIHTYLHLSSEDARALWKAGYGVMAVAHHLGLARLPAEALLVAISGAAAAAMVYVGLLRGRERDALVLAVLLMLLASPLVWSHYFSLLLIPIALARPRLAPAWGIGLLMWPLPPRQPVYGWGEVLIWGLAAISIALAMKAEDRAALEDRGERFARPVPV